MTSTTQAAQESLEHTPKQSRDHTMMGQIPSSGPNSSVQGVAVPDMAHPSYGGWFNPTNWLLKIVLNRVGHMTLDELLVAFFAREARPSYGENHRSTRGKKGREAEPLDGDEDLHVNSKKRSTENHKRQERDRRDRHRVLQRENDNCTPTVIFDLAEKELPKVKTLVKNMSAEELENDDSPLAPSGEAQSSKRAAKKTGKDDQFLSAALFQWLSAFIILRERQARLETEGKVQQLENELKEAHARHIEADDRIARLEADNRYYADEVSYSRQQLDQRHDSRRGSSDSSSFSQPHLLPSVTSRKRPASSLDCSSANNASAEKRYCLGAEPMHRLPHGERRCHLPPSPTPSCDECVSSFCSCCPSTVS